MFCGNCGSENAAGLNFCVKCGAPLEQAAQPGPAATQAMPTQAIPQQQPTSAPAAATQAMPTQPMGQPPVGQGVPPTGMPPQQGQQFQQPPQPPQPSKGGLPLGAVIGIVAAVVVVVLVVVVVFGGSGKSSSSTSAASSSAASSAVSTTSASSASADTSASASSASSTSSASSSSASSASSASASSSATPTTGMQTVGNNACGTVQVPKSWTDRSGDYDSRIVDSTSLVYYADPSSEYTSSAFAHFMFSRAIQLRCYNTSYTDAAQRTIDGYDKSIYSDIDKQESTFNGRKCIVITASVPQDGIYTCDIAVDRDGSGKSAVLITVFGTPSSIEEVLGYASTWTPPK